MWFLFNIEDDSFATCDIKEENIEAIMGQIDGVYKINIPNFSTTSHPETIDDTDLSALFYDQEAEDVFIPSGTITTGTATGKKRLEETLKSEVVLPKEEQSSFIIDLAKKELSKSVYNEIMKDSGSDSSGAEDVLDALGA